MRLTCSDSVLLTLLLSAPKEQDLEPMKEDFFSKLEYLLRFLNHNTLPKETA